MRDELFRECELRAVISLPRVFKNNNARMAVIYLARNPANSALPPGHGMLELGASATDGAEDAAQ